MAIQKITAPSGASTEVVSIQPTVAIQLDFDTNTASVDRAESDLIINFVNGGQVVISDFFVTEGQELPIFTLSDGSQISSVELLQNMNPDLDLTTASGPSSRADGSGAGDYSDGAGDLMGGVDRLGSLGTFGWSRDIEISDEVDGSLLAGVGAGIMTPPATPDVPDFPDVPDTDDSLVKYNARAVLYRPNGGNDDASTKITIDLLDGSHTPVNPPAVEVDFADPDAEKYFDWVVTSNGKLELTLTAEGQAAIDQDGVTNIYSYLSVSVPGEDPYVVQVIANKDGNFSSSATDKDYTNGGVLDGSLIYGEWHSGPGLVGANIESSGKNDELTFTGDLGDVRLVTGDGDDSASVTGDVLSGTTINLGTGENYLSINGRVEANTVAVEITGNSGNDVIDIFTPFPDVIDRDRDQITSISGRGTEVRISLGDGDNTLSATGMPGIPYWATVGALSGGSLEISGGKDNDILNINGSVWINGESSGVINLGDGDNKLLLTGWMEAEDSSNLHITGGNGKNIISVASLINATEKSELSIELEGESIIKSKIFSAYSGSSASIRTGNDNDFIEIGTFYSFDNTRSVIDLGNGDNKLNLNYINVQRNFADGYTKILMGDGNDALTIGPGEITSVHTASGALHIDMGNGDNRVSIEGVLNTGISSGGDSSSKITTGDGNDVIFIDGSMRITAGASGHGENIIETGRGNDYVRLGEGMEVIFGGGDLTRTGVNMIDTGKGHDVVSVAGKVVSTDLSGTRIINRIETGEGNDVVHLHLNDTPAEWESMVLELSMGAGDYDTLMLTASDFDSFNKFYNTLCLIKDGLKYASIKDGLQNASVEHVHINGLETTTDLGRIKSYLGSVDVSYDDGETMFLNGLNAGEVNLGGLLDVAKGITTLDFSGKKANNINLDSLLDGHETINGLRIIGDSDDKVILSDNWKLSDQPAAEGFVALTSGEHSIAVHESLLDESLRMTLEILSNS